MPLTASDTTLYFRPDSAKGVVWSAPLGTTLTDYQASPVNTYENRGTGVVWMADSSYIYMQGYKVITTGGTGTMYAPHDIYSADQDTNYLYVMSSGYWNVKPYNTSGSCDVTVNGIYRVTK